MRDRTWRGGPGRWHIWTKVGWLVAVLAAIATAAVALWLALQ